MLALLRRLHPEQSFTDDIEGLREDKSIVANRRAEELLKRLKMGRAGFS